MRACIAPFATLTSLLQIAGRVAAFTAKTRFTLPFYNFYIRGINYYKQNFDNAKTVPLVAVPGYAAQSLYGCIKHIPGKNAGTNNVFSIMFSTPKTAAIHGAALSAGN